MEAVESRENGHVDHAIRKSKTKKSGSGYLKHNKPIGDEKENGTGELTLKKARTTDSSK